MAEDQTIHDPFARGGAYGNDMLTMSGPIGQRKRRQGLVPGVTRLADGTIYQGNTMEQNLIEHIRTLRAEIEAKELMVVEAEAQLAAMQSGTEVEEPHPQPTEVNEVEEIEVESEPEPVKKSSTRKRKPKSED